MDEKDILNQINEIFANVLKQPGLTLAAETTATDVTGWTSLTHMILIDHVESHFGVKFKLNEIMKFNNVGEMVSCVLKKKSK